MNLRNRLFMIQKGHVVAQWKQIILYIQREQVSFREKPPIQKTQPCKEQWLP